MGEANLKRITRGISQSHTCSATQVLNWKLERGWVQQSTACDIWVVLPKFRASREAKTPTLDMHYQGKQRTATISVRSKKCGYSSTSFQCDATIVTYAPLLHRGYISHVKSASNKRPQHIPFTAKPGSVASECSSIATE